MANNKLSTLFAGAMLSSLTLAMTAPITSAYAFEAKAADSSKEDCQESKSKFFTDEDENCSDDEEGGSDKANKDKKDKKIEIKPIEEIIKDWDKVEGLFPVYQDPKTGAVMLEVSQAQLNKNYLLTLQVVDAPISSGLARGSFGPDKVLQFRKRYNKIEMVIVNTNFYFDPESPLARAKDANVSDSIVAIENIKGQNEAKDIFVIDVTKLFMSEQLTKLTHRNTRPNAFNLGGISKDKSRITKISNHPENTGIRTALTFENLMALGRVDSGITDKRFITLTVQHDFVEIPEDNGFVPRKNDSRVGFFNVQKTNQTTVEGLPYYDFIRKWNLVKKDPSLALSEPVEPVVYWLENTTPVEHRNTVKKAVEAWNVAFEAAGFKNAIVVKIQPDDATWDADDMRYNVIRWISTANPSYSGFGPAHANPINGEIFATNIMIEYGFLRTRMKSADVFFGNSSASYSQTSMSFSDDEIDHSAVDSQYISALNEHGQNCSFANEMQLGQVYSDAIITAFDLDEDERAELVRQALTNLIMHEVGHTLGLMHNMKASSAMPYETVHDKSAHNSSFVSSVMDYTPTNFAPPGTKQGWYYNTTPGAYDIWAIKFGYSPELENADKMKIHLDLSSKPEYTFGNDADDMRAIGRGIDPRVNIGDMSDDAIAYSIDRAKLDRLAISRLQERFVKDGESYAQLRGAYRMAMRDLGGSANIISRFVGGVYVERTVAGQPGAKIPYTPVDRATQKRAMAALSEHFFAPDAYTFDPDLMRHLAIQRRGFETMGLNSETPKPLLEVAKQQGALLKQLLHKNTLFRINETENWGNEYPMYELLADLTTAIFNADINSSVNKIRKQLQTNYVDMLLKIVNSNKAGGVIGATVLAEVDSIRTLLKSTKRGGKVTKGHRQLLVLKIDRALSVNRVAPLTAKR